MLNKTIYVVFPRLSTRVQCYSETNCIYFGHESRRAQGTLGFLNQTWVFPGPPHISALLKKTVNAQLHSQTHGAPAQRSRLPLQRGADEQITEQKQRPVLLTAHRFLQHREGQRFRKLIRLLKVIWFLMFICAHRFHHHLLSQERSLRIQDLTGKNTLLDLAEGKLAYILL